MNSDLERRIKGLEVEGRTSGLGGWLVLKNEVDQSVVYGQREKPWWTKRGQR